RCWSRTSSATTSWSSISRRASNAARSATLLRNPARCAPSPRDSLSRGRRDLDALLALARRLLGGLHFALLLLPLARGLDAPALVVLFQLQIVRGGGALRRDLLGRRVLHARRRLGALRRGGARRGPQRQRAGQYGEPKGSHEAHHVSKLITKRATRDAA